MYDIHQPMRYMRPMDIHEIHECHETHDDTWLCTACRHAYILMLRAGIHYVHTATVLHTLHYTLVGLQDITNVSFLMLPGTACGIVPHRIAPSLDVTYVTYGCHGCGYYWSSCMRYIVYMDTLVTLRYVWTYTASGVPWLHSTLMGLQDSTSATPYVPVYRYVLTLYLTSGYYGWTWCAWIPIGTMDESQWVLWMYATVHCILYTTYAQRIALLHWVEHCTSTVVYY